MATSTTGDSSKVGLSAFTTSQLPLKVVGKTPPAASIIYHRGVHCQRTCIKPTMCNALTSWKIPFIQPTGFLLYDQLHFLGPNSPKTGLKILAAVIFYNCSSFSCSSVFSGSHALLGGWLVGCPHWDQSPFLPCHCPWHFTKHHMMNSSNLF